VAKEVEERGGTAHVHPADLADTADIERMANEVVEQHGGVDILVNNAGRSIRRSVKYQSDRFHDFERTMQLNYFGALRLILTFLPGMRERKTGHIINISSYSVQMNTPRFAAYAASKAALDQFSRCLAAEVVDKRIFLTTIYMPLVRTPMIAPTDFYKSLPALEPEEAGQLVTDAMIDKPKRVAKRLGTTAQVLYTLNPKVTDQIAHTVYRLFPEKDPKKKEAERRAREEGGADAQSDGQGEEISSEATALAYLMRGVYF
jgi:NAD(P)-dependent dehydrogenase (short-subunit alcohol dehydrogenase family)